jgi:hypothetical protein
MPPAPPSPDTIRTVAATMRVDLLGAEVIAALEAAGIPCIVLKGRAFADALYPGEARPYDDTDLLVPEALGARAEGVLARLGYEPRPGSVSVADAGAGHARQWDRQADDAHVDLHVRLNGAGAGGAAVWEVLSARTAPVLVGGRDALGLDGPASGMLCALHLAAHGTAAKPHEDLARALRRLSAADWREAREIALALDAEEAFTAGLRFSADGRRVADALGLPASLSAARRLQVDPAAPSGARMLEEIASQPSPVAGLRVLIGLIAPPVAKMRKHHPLARRGHAGLIASYALRPLRLVWLTPRALLSWLLARRATRR